MDTKFPPPLFSTRDDNSLARPDALFPPVELFSLLLEPVSFCVCNTAGSNYHEEDRERGDTISQSERVRRK